MALITMSITRSLFSPHWYRVQSITPRLKKHAQIHRHTYRGQRWYVLEDRLSGRYHRFSPAAYWLISQMRGKQTLAELWERAVGCLGDEAPTQHETIQLLGQLHGADVLASNVPPDLLELFDRYKHQKKHQWLQRLASPLAIKVPLFDPDTFLERNQHRVKPLFSALGVLLWCLLVGSAVLLAVQNWSALSDNVRDTVLTPGNLLLMALIFPLIKAAHELGHAFAAKIWNGEVHEIGIMFLVFIPVPYVDASCASAFRERYKRVIVGFGGMLVELAIAAVAIIYWVYAEPGVARTIAYNVIIIAGVTTLFFNANPLLRFDGYYVLADILEIPNLFARAQQYYAYLFKKTILGLVGDRNPATSPGEPFWFIVFGLCSYVYRVFIVIAIALFIASKFFTIGVLLAAWSFIAAFILPIYRGIRFLLEDTRVQRRALAVYLKLTSVALLCIVGIGFVPLPYWTNAQGVVWLPEKSILRSGADCFVKDILLASQSAVKENQPVILCSDPLIESSIIVKQGLVREHEIKYVESIAKKPLDAELQRVALDSVRADFNRSLEIQAEQTVVSPLTGRLIIPLQQDLQDRFVKKGDILAYVIPEDASVIRAVVTQKHAGLVRSDTRTIELRLASHISQVLGGVLLREVPGASEQLPNAALGSYAGGNIPVDPRDPERVTTFDKVFQFDIKPNEWLGARFLYGRVQLRFHHSPQTLWQRAYRNVRLVLMEHFGV